MIFLCTFWNHPDCHTQSGVARTPHSYPLSGTNEHMEERPSISNSLYISKNRCWNTTFNMELLIENRHETKEKPQHLISVPRSLSTAGCGIDSSSFPCSLSIKLQQKWEGLEFLVLSLNCRKNRNLKRASITNSEPAKHINNKILKYFANLLCSEVSLTLLSPTLWYYYKR